MATDHERDFAFTLTRSEGDTDENDGLTFEGYAAVFNQPAHIRDADGEYDEVFSPGAFKQTINRGKPYFMFCHGKHPLLGQMPLGTITELREDPRGLFVKARLTDNWLISPVRDAIRDGAVTGMSIRFGPVKEKWTGRPSLACRHGELRTVHEARVVELGPVVVPSYADTTASVRSAFHTLEDVVDGLTINVGLREGIETVSTQEQTVLDLVKRAIKDRWGLDESSDVDVTDYYEEDNKLVFTVGGTQASEYSGLWRAEYTYTDGAVSLSGDPQAVEAVPASYVPRSLELSEPSPTESTDEVERTQDLGPSEEAAISPSTEAAAKPDRVPRSPMTSPAEREAFLREVELNRRGIKVGAT